MSNIHEKTFLLTDGCMWEATKEEGNEHPHCIEVVDIETGAVRYIKSGSRIKFLAGEITDIRSSQEYKEQTEKSSLPNYGQTAKKRTECKGKSKKRGATSL